MAKIRRTKRWRGPPLGDPLQRASRFCFAGHDGEATTAQLTEYCRPELVHRGRRPTEWQMQEQRRALHSIGAVRVRRAGRGLDTTTPAGKAMFQMLGVFAEFERTMIAERIRAGLARARSEGKRLGRPRIAPALEKRIREALATPGRPGVRIIAKRFSVDPGTVQRISRPFAGAVAAIP
jgi:hypothetical protein